MRPLPPAAADPRAPDSEACDICGARGMERDLQVSLAGAVAAWICRCTGCGFRQVRPRLAPALLPALYSSDYFDSTRPVGYRDYARQAQRRRREAWFLSRWLRRHSPDGPVLEVGCALGFLLAALRERGHDVAGIDVSAFAAYYARTRFSIDVRPTTLDEANFPDESFACVVQKDVLEHVIAPREHLRATWRVLRPGGWLWIVTPNGEANLRPLHALARRMAGGDMLPLIDQSHLSFFAPEHLRRLFTECGFDIVRARTIGVRRGLRALGWLPGQARFAHPVPRPGAGVTPGAVSGDSGDARFEALAVQIDREGGRAAATHRARPAAYYLHRAAKLLDQLPGTPAVGYDFEFVLRKRLVA